MVSKNFAISFMIPLVGLLSVAAVMLLPVDP